MNKFERSVDLLAQELYNTHWKPNPTTGRCPPAWPDVSKATKEFVREQAINVAKMALARDWSGTEFANIKAQKCPF